MASAKMADRAVIHGARVTLRPVRENDLPKIVEWDSDEEITRWAGKKFRSAEEAIDWFRSGHHLQRRNWIIEVPGNPSPKAKAIGEVEVANISWRLHTGEIRVVIGEKAYWNQGLGQDAVRACVSGLFRSTSLEEVFLRVDGRNVRALHCYKKVGFRAQGRILLRLNSAEPTPLILMKLRRQDLG